MRGCLVERRLWRVLVFLVAITACFGASRAVAGPPYVTDDPGPVDYRHYQTYLGFQYQNTGSGQVSWALPFAELDYGLMPNVQLAVSSSMMETYGSGSGSYTYGGTSFGAKVRFIQESANRPDIAFAPSVQFPANAGDHAVTFLPIWLQKTAGPWTVFGGGGLYINRGPGNQDYTYFGAAVTRAISPATTLGVELFHQGANTVGGSDTTGTNLGVVTQIDAHNALLFSIGRSLNNGGNSLTAYAAWNFVFGPKESK